MGKHILFLKKKIFFMTMPLFPSSILSVFVSFIIPEQDNFMKVISYSMMLLQT